VNNYQRLKEDRIPDHGLNWLNLWKKEGSILKIFSNCTNRCIQNLWELQTAAGCHWFPQKFWISECHALPSPGHIPSCNPCHQGSEWLHLSLSMPPLKQTPARTRDYKEYCLLLCYTIQSGRYLLMVWRNLMPLSSRQPFWSNIPKNIIYEELIVKFLFTQLSLFLVSPSSTTNSFRTYWLHKLRTKVPLQWTW